MPLLVDPALSQGTLRDATQPRLAINGGLVLRPWKESDAATVRTAFACPDIQRWHVRRLDTLDEAGEWARQWADRWDALRPNLIGAGAHATTAATLRARSSEALQVIDGLAPEDGSDSVVAAIEMAKPFSKWQVI